jgi:predicted CoA-binding protein
MSNLAAIQAFLACRRLALVGVSRDPKDFSRVLFRDLAQRGYDVVPINPLATEIERRPSYPSVQGLAQPVDAAMLLTAPEQSLGAVRDCLDAGVRRVWFHRGMGPGSASPAALRLCRERGAEVVSGECLYMHLVPSALPHRVHGFFRHLGRQPAA